MITVIKTANKDLAANKDAFDRGIHVRVEYILWTTLLA